MKSVVVVGAGVSGCACAAALAGYGLQVTLVNSAMDRVGLPTYGPDIIAEPGPWEELDQALAAVPEPVRRVWLEAGLRPSGGDPIVNVDRRRVSIELKRMLEHLPGLDFRQGFVVDVRSGGGDAGVEVETIFGEVFEADAVVLAVGLSLDGTCEVGEDRMRAGRYGEPGSDGLFRALGRLGAEFTEMAAEVGATIAGADARGRREAMPSLGGLGEPWEAEDLIPACADPGLVSWPDDYPPAPHMDPGLRTTTMMFASCGAEGQPLGSSGTRRPVLSPDEGCGDEISVAPGRAPLDGEKARGDGDYERSGDDAEAVYVRMPLRITAQAVSSLGAGGRLSAGQVRVPLWVCGRAGGALHYLGSLGSGVRVARDVFKWIEGGCE